MNGLLIVVIALLGLAESVSTDLGGPTPMANFYESTCNNVQGTWKPATAQSFAECADVPWHEVLPGRSDP